MIKHPIKRRMSGRAVHEEQNELQRPLLLRSRSGEDDRDRGDRVRPPFVGASLNHLEGDYQDEGLQLSPRPGHGRALTDSEGYPNLRHDADVTNLGYDDDGYEREHSSDGEDGEDENDAKRGGNAAKFYSSEGEALASSRQRRQLESGNKMSLRQLYRLDSFQHRQNRMPKRGGRRRMRRRETPRKVKARLSAYCISTELHTRRLYAHLQSKDSRRDPMSSSLPYHPPSSSRHDEEAWVDALYLDVIHSSTDLDAVPGVPASAAFGEAERRESVDRGDGDQAEPDWEAQGDGNTLVMHKDVFVYPYGCVIFWGCTLQEEQELLAEMRQFAVGLLKKDVVEDAQDDMTFSYIMGDDEAVIKGDNIMLRTRGPIEKISYSFALAQSAKLFVFENQLDDTIESTRKYPEILMKTGSIGLSERQINKLIGKVLMDRNEVNLHSDILSNPEFFWDTDAYEPQYQALCEYLDIPLRLEILNQRLDILRELLDILNQTVMNTHATRLEVIIIWLVGIEAAVELIWNVIIKDILGFFS